MHWINYVRNTKISIQNRQIDKNLKSIWFHIEILQISINTNNYTPANEVWGYIGITLSVCLSVRLSVRLSVQSKLNLCYNFWTKSDRALILHKCIPCDKTFLLILKFLTLWPSPWLLTYFWKNLTLGANIFTSWPWPWLLTYYWKKLNLDHNFWTKSDRALILHTSILCDKTFLLIPIFLT